MTSKPEVLEHGCLCLFQQGLACLPRDILTVLYQSYTMNTHKPKLSALFLKESGTAVTHSQNQYI